MPSSAEGEFNPWAPSYDPTCLSAKKKQSINNRSNIVTKSIKIFKIVHIKKNFKKLVTVKESKKERERKCGRKEFKGVKSWTAKKN